MSFRALLRPHFHFSVLGLQFSVLLALATTALSQATFPSPTLTSIVPLSGRPGETLRLTLRGGDLEAPTAILLHDRSLAITPVKTNIVTVTLPADLEPGFYDLRFIGRFGVSNPRAFQVSALASQTSPATNSKPESAVRATVGSMIQGAFKAALPQWFAFDAKKGQLITASFDSARFDVRTELMGAVIDAEGRELARMKNGALLFNPPADGSYHLRLNDLMHRGGDDYGFCVTLEELTFTLPYASDRYVWPNALKLGDVSTSAFQPGGAPSLYQFAFKAGDKFVIEVSSHQLGHPSDPHLFIELLKPDGTYSPVAQIADAPAITPAPSLALPNRDPSYAYEAKADGTFRISLNDTFNTTSPFELRVLPAAASTPRLIALHASLPVTGARKGYDFGTANVCRGSILALEIAAANRHALSEAIELKADHLPPGLTCLGGFIGKGQSLGYLAFQAAAEAPAAAALVTSIPEAACLSFPVADAARDNLLVRRTGPPAIGVSALPAPALILTEKTETYEVTADGKVEIALKVTRHADFTDALKLKALGLVEAAKAPEADIPAKATTGKFTLDVKALKLAPGEYGFILQGPAKMKVQREVEALAAANIKLKDAAELARKAASEIEFADRIRKNPKVGDDLEANSEALKRALADAARAEAQKKAADTLIKDLTAKSPPKDATFIVCSNPIRIRVRESK